MSGAMSDAHMGEMGGGFARPMTPVRLSGPGDLSPALTPCRTPFTQGGNFGKWHQCFGMAGNESSTIVIRGSTTPERNDLPTHDPLTTNLTSYPHTLHPLQLPQD